MGLEILGVLVFLRQVNMVLVLEYLKGFMGQLLLNLGLINIFLILLLLINMEQCQECILKLRLDFFINIFILWVNLLLLLGSNFILLVLICLFYWNIIKVLFIDRQMMLFIFKVWNFLNNCLQWGKWLEEQVGVKVLGREKSIIFLLLKICLVVLFF